MSEYDLWNPLLWDILPDFRLLKARRQYAPSTGSTLKTHEIGDFGLHRGDSVDYHFRIKPMPNPCDGLSDEEEEVLFDDPNFDRLYQEFEDRVRDFQRQLTTSYDGMENFEMAYELIESSVKAGFDPKKGSWYHWFFHRIYQFTTNQSGYYEPEVARWIEDTERRIQERKMEEMIARGDFVGDGI